MQVRAKLACRSRYKKQSEERKPSSMNTSVYCRASSNNTVYIIERMTKKYRKNTSAKSKRM